MKANHEEDRSPAEVVPIGEPEIRQLLVSAGPRPGVPGAEMARLKAAARETWSRTFPRRRALGRWPAPVAVAAVLALAIAAGWWWMRAQPPIQAGAVATVEWVEGTAFASRVVAGGDEEIVPLAVGLTLSTGSGISTVAGPGGSPSRLALRLAGGRSLRLDGGSRAVLLRESRVELQQGALYVDAGPGAEESGAIEVLTRFGSVREIGTQFEVRLAAGESPLRVRVREGAVTLRRDGDALSAAAGEELTLRRDGSVLRQRLEPFDPSWAWAAAAAPSLDIEGIALSEFLAWVSRETGLAVEFASGELRRSAAGIRLHGTIEGLTPEESLSVVLPGSGLVYRVEAGRLLVGTGS